MASTVADHVLDRLRAWGVGGRLAYMPFVAAMVLLASNGRERVAVGVDHQMMTAVRGAPIRYMGLEPG